MRGRSKRPQRRLGFLVLALVALEATAQSQPVVRQVLHGHVPAAVAKLPPLESLAATQRMRLAIALPLRSRPQLDHLLGDLYDPASPRFHQYLTASQFADTFGPSEQDYAEIAAFAQAHHLTVIGSHPNRTLLDVEGSVAAIEAAFHLELHRYQHPTEDRLFFAPDRDPTLDLETPVLSITGLDNFVLPRPMQLQAEAGGRLAPPGPRFRTNATPPNLAYATGSAPGYYFIGKDFRAAYAPGVSLDGSGQSVGLFELDGYFASDITAYESLASLPNVALTNVLLDNFSGAPGSENLEVALDIEMTICMAPGLAQVIVYEGKSPNDVLNRMATDNLARQLSCSWGFGEQVDPAREQIYEQFAAQGQSLFQASGDFGAWVGPIAPPSDDPWLTVVGGTSLTTAGQGGAWASESVWPLSGGGISTSYLIPLWQQGLNMSLNQGSTTMRNVPDLACLADTVIWAVAYNGQEGTTGGTSAAAPLWAGFMALVNQQAAASGQPSPGFLNPAIYALGQGTQYSSAFHDITVGNNTNGPSPTNFFAVAGYDLCTGWGTPTGSNFIGALLPPADALGIAPVSPIVFSGLAGGPFSPGAQGYALTNLGSTALTWGLINTSIWLAASSAGGTLYPGGPAATVVFTANSTASNLPTGSYSAMVCFSNLNDHSAQTRPATLAVAASTLLAPVAAFSLLHNFTGGTDGANPNGLARGSDGGFYGTAMHGGTNTAGTLFQMNSQGAIAGLYSFAGTIDGALPASPLIQTADGALYGTTFAGGVYGLGTTFTATTNGSLASLLSFNYDHTNAILPYAGLSLGPDGNFYGTGYEGGTNIYGCVFQMTPGGTQTNLYSFTGGSDGSYPYAGLLLASDGNFYGTTYNGGANSCGTVFRISSRGALTTLASFNFTNGAFPYSGLAQGDDGNFYGVASSGGANGQGVVFEVSPSGSFTNLYSFAGTNGGRRPVGGLLLGPDGNWYGTTANGGASDAGTIFWMPPGGTPQTLVQFNGLQGANPRSALVPGADRDLYGTTQNGGANGAGTAFRLGIIAAPQITSQPANQSAFAGASVTFSVAAFGSQPLAYQWLFNGTNLTDGGNVAGSTNRLLKLSNVDLGAVGYYSVLVSNALGTADSAPAILEVVNAPAFITTQPTNLTLAPGATATFNVSAIGNQPLLFQWKCGGINLTDGGNVSGSASSTLTLSGVTEANNGVYSVLVSNELDAVTSTGATLLVIPPSAPGTLLQTLYSFGGGLRQPSGLTPASDGNLYGTTASGGSSPSYGAVFKVSTNGAVNVVAQFDTQSGISPEAGLVQGADSNFYGTTAGGGTNMLGNVFRMTPGGVLTNIYSFSGGTNGSSPDTLLTQGAGGFLFGTTANGGAGGVGSVFRVSTNGAFATVYSFTGGNDGAAPVGELTLGSDGIFYGVTTNKGAHGYGTVFKLTPGGTLTTLYSFTGGLDGYDPNPLVQGTDGNLYGTTTYSSIRGFPLYGCIFSISPNSAFTTLYSLNYNDGNYPQAGLIQANDGNFYGTTSLGGTYGNGIVFRITSSGTLTTLVSFDGFDDGALPETALAQGADGNLYGTTSSGGAAGQGTIFRLSMTGAPQITVPPTGQTVAVGASAVFSVAATGAAPLGYQWQKNGTNLAGAGTRILSLGAVASSDAGVYTVIVSNAFGAVTSPGAVLTVLTPPVFQTVTRSNAILSLTWSAVMGLTYQLQYKSAIAADIWSNLGNPIVATNAMITETDPLGANTQRYYRVLLEP